MVDYNQKRKYHVNYQGKALLCKATNHWSCPYYHSEDETVAGKAAVRMNKMCDEVLKADAKGRRKAAKEGTEYDGFEALEVLKGKRFMEKLPTDYEVMNIYHLAKQKQMEAITKALEKKDLPPEKRLELEKMRDEVQSHIEMVAGSHDLTDNSKPENVIKLEKALDNARSLSYIRKRERKLNGKRPTINQMWAGAKASQEIVEKDIEPGTPEYEAMEEFRELKKRLDRKKRIRRKDIDQARALLYKMNNAHAKKNGLTEDVDCRQHYVKGRCIECYDHSCSAQHFVNSERAQNHLNNLNSSDMPAQITMHRSNRGMVATDNKRNAMRQADQHLLSAYDKKTGEYIHFDRFAERWYGDDPEGLAQVQAQIAEIKEFYRTSGVKIGANGQRLMTGHDKMEFYASVAKTLHNANYKPELFAAQIAKMPPELRGNTLPCYQEFKELKARVMAGEQVKPPVDAIGKTVDGKPKNKIKVKDSAIKKPVSTTKKQSSDKPKKNSPAKEPTGTDHVKTNIPQEVFRGFYNDKERKDTVERFPDLIKTYNKSKKSNKSPMDDPVLMGSLESFKRDLMLYGTKNLKDAAEAEDRRRYIKKKGLSLDYSGDIPEGERRSSKEFDFCNELKKKVDQYYQDKYHHVNADDLVSKRGTSARRVTPRKITPKAKQ